jgi:hypothetical protein
VNHWESPASYWLRRPTQWNQRPSSRSSASTWPAWDQFRQHATCPQQPSCTRTSTTACTSFFARTQFAGLWSPLTAAPTRTSRGERRRCNSLYAASPSPCPPTGLNRPTNWTRPTAGTHLPTATQPARFRRCHRHLSRLQAPVVTSASNISAWGGGVVGPSHKAPGVKSRTGYLATEQSDATMQDWLLATEQRKPNKRKRFYLVGLESTSKGDTTEREILLLASSSIVHTRRLGTAIATIYSRSAQATSSYQRSEDFSGNLWLNRASLKITPHRVGPQWRATFPVVFRQQRKWPTPRGLA